MSDTFKAIALGALAAAAIVVIPGSCHIVPPGHKGVSVTLGSVDSKFREEGFNVKKPWIEKIFDVSTQQRTVENQTEVFSSDLQAIKMLYSCMYKLPADKVVTLYTDYKGDPYDSLVRPQIEEKMKQISATYTAEDLVKNRELAKQLVLKEVQGQLEGLVIVQDIILRNMDLSEPLQAEIEKKVIENQKSQAKKYQLEAAKGDAEISITKAKAEAEAMRIKSEMLTQNPSLIEWEVVQKWNGVSPQTIVSAGGRAANILLPLK